MRTTVISASIALVVALLSSGASAGPSTRNSFDQRTDGRHEPPALEILPFAEVVNPKQLLLFEAKNFVIATKVPRPGNPTPVIKLQGKTILSLEVTTRKPYLGTYFFSWSDKAGSQNEIWPAEYVRVWPFESQVPLEKETDVFESIPVFPSAKGVSLYYVDNKPSQGPTLGTLEQLKLYGTTTKFISVKDRAALVMARSSGGTSYQVNFKSLGKKEAGGPLSGMGARVSVGDVQSAYVVSRDHTIRRLHRGEARVLGSFLPHMIVYQDSKGVSHGIYFSGCDLLTVNFRTAAKELTVHAYTFHMAERSLRGYTKTPEVPAGGGAREGSRRFRNLGAFEFIPAHSMRISHGPVTEFLFPLWQPSGRLATMILTEHADYHEAATDALVTFGNGQRVVAQGQGLTGNQIPYTKSIFPMGPDIPFVKDINGKKIPFRQSSYTGNAAFHDLIRQYREMGLPIEFGVHTAGTINYTIEETRKGLEAVRELGSRVWIDHGSVEVGLHRYGWDKTQPAYYLLPTLKNYGYSYAWADSEVLHLQPQKDLSLIQDNAPSRLLYYLPELDTDPDDDWRLSIFSTRPLQWSAELFSPQNLAEFISKRSITILHVYLAYSVVEYDLDGKGARRAQLAPWYNPSMQNLSAEMSSHRLHITTLAAWGDFVQSVRALKVMPAEGGYVVDNPGGPIQGLTFSVLPIGSPKARPHVTLDGKPVKDFKIEDRVYYFWIDLPNGSHKIDIRYPRNE